jgi:transposase
MFQQNLGVDVAAKTLQVCLKVRRANGSIKVAASRKFVNTAKGYAQLMTWLGKKQLADTPMRVTMEATGVYYEGLAYHLHDQGCQVHVLLPNRIKGYLQFLNLKSKTDRLEAEALAELGIQQELPVWQPASPQMYSLKGFSRERHTLIDQKTVIMNRLHAEQACQSPDRRTLKRLRQQVRLLEKQIKEVEQDLQHILEQDPALRQKVEHICQIKGLGWISVLSIIAETNGFQLVTHKSQLVSYAGYDVVERQSGSSVKGKTRISKKGNRHIRRILHFPALGVVKYQDEFKKLYQRVYDRTKVKMKGYVAVQRKLLVLIYTLYKKNEAYDPNYAHQQTSQQTSRQGTMPAYTG